MGADERLFKHQVDAFPNVIVPLWQRPERGESLAGYARRLAAIVDPGRPCFVGGASFGGFVALEMAPHLDCLGCFLIGSARGSAGMAGSIRAIRPLGRSLAAMPFGWIGPAAWVARWTVGLFCHPLTRAFLRHLQQTDSLFLRWGFSAALRWAPSPATGDVRVFQIHGERDRLFPARRSGAEVVLPGAGHLISLTRPGAVNDFLRRRMMAATCPTSA
jgi:pimeloyl-ACP methyl ester carboxylesterase